MLWDGLRSGMMVKRVYGQLILSMVEFLLFLTSSALATDEASLLAFKQIVQDPTGVLSNWNSSSNSLQVCNWTGVTCDAQTLRVTNLKLRSFQLGGSISPSIGGLSELTVLDLSDNNFDGSIPDSLGNCTKLVSLTLSNNLLSGDIPASAFGNFRLLQSLLLSNNNLTSTIPSALGNCSELQTLDLSFNKLEGSIPASLGNCAQLISLTLSNNALVGSIPSSFGNLLKLQGLFINSNSLKGEFPIELLLALNKTLTELGLSGNQLTGSLPDKFNEFQVLSKLDLSSNNFTGALPNTLGRVGTLTLMNLAYNGFTGPLPWSTGSIQPTFQIGFNLSHNFLNGSLGPLSNLVFTVLLDVSRNEFSGSIPENASKCIYLTTVDLSQNFLTGEIPSSLDSVQYLNVSYNNLTGSIDEFTNRTASTFLPGNDGLCGWILKRPCPEPSPGPGAAPTVTPPERPPEFYRKRTTTIMYCVIAIFIFGFVLVFVSWFDGMRLKSTRHLNDAVTCYGRGLEMVRLTVKDLLVATRNFNERHVIGTGGTSTVYKGVLPFYPFIIAVKKFKDDEDGRQCLLKEAGIMSIVRHRNIVGTLGLASIPRSVNVLVLEYVANRTLNHHLHGKSTEVCGIGWEVRLNIAIDVATAVSYLHEDTDQRLAVIHGDLKPSNIFLDSDFSAKVGDFGLAKLLVDVDCVNRSEQKWEGTFGYSPPGDVYSFGIVVLEMATRRRPASLAFEDLGGSFINWVQAAFPDRLSEIVDPCLKLEEDFSSKKGAIDLFIRIGLLCTRDNPRERPKMREALEMIKTLVVVESTTETAPTLVRSMDELINESSTTSFQHAKAWGWVNKDFIVDSRESALYYDSWISIFKLDLRDSRTLKAMGFDTAAVTNIRKQTHQRRAATEKTSARMSWIRTIWRALCYRGNSRRIEAH